MGSTGSGSFTDYQGYSSGNPKQGGESKENKCEKAFRTELEDIELSSYFMQNRDIPNESSDITINFNGHRIVALVNNKEIGNLPTKFNYLRRCLESYTYKGIVANTTREPIISIIINVSPNE